MLRGGRARDRYIALRTKKSQGQRVPFRARVFARVDRPPRSLDPADILFLFPPSFFSRIVLVVLVVVVVVDDSDEVEEEEVEEEEEDAVAV